MIERENITEEELKELIKVNKLVPNRGKVIVTINSIVYEEGELEDSNNVLDDTQYVVAASPNSTFVEAGSKVILNLQALSVPVSATHDAFEQNMQLNLDYVVVNGHVLAFVNESVIKARYTQ